MLLEELASDTELGQEAEFFAEVLNDPEAQSYSILNISSLEPYSLEDSFAAGNYIIIDPAGDTHLSDDTAIGYVEVHGGVPVLIDIISEVMSPLETIKAALRFALKYNCGVVAAEAVAYQKTLLFWFDYIAVQMGIQGIEFVPAKTGQKQKHVRINAWLKSYKAQEVSLGPNVFSQVLAQLKIYDPLKRDNVDDILDVCAYMLPVFQEYKSFIASSMHTIETADSALAGVPFVDDIETSVIGNS